MMPTLPILQLATTLAFGMHAAGPAGLTSDQNRSLRVLPFFPSLCPANHFCWSSILSERPPPYTAGERRLVRNREPCIGHEPLSWGAAACCARPGQATRRCAGKRRSGRPSVGLHRTGAPGQAAAGPLQDAVMPQVCVATGHRAVCRTEKTGQCGGSTGLPEPACMLPHQPKSCVGLPACICGLLTRPVE